MIVFAVMWSSYIMKVPIIEKVYALNAKDSNKKYSITTERCQDVNKSKHK